MHRSSTRLAPPELAVSASVAQTTPLYDPAIAARRPPPATTTRRTSSWRGSTRSNLPTPPPDAMATTALAMPHPAPQQILPNLQPGPQPGRRDAHVYAGATCGGGDALVYPPQNDWPSASNANARTANAQMMHAGMPTSSHRRSSPRQYDSTDSHAEDPKRLATSSSASSMPLAALMAKHGGSLADFAAQITCFFWFESIDTLHKAETLSATSSPLHRLREGAWPSASFTRWVHAILSTTQVTTNVTLLALLFIYRLKAFNANVKGKAGSEYRLLTVALMLGNKFLDDNTYTNKTWAEVSGISVAEIHVMEVEFLSNMRYTLLASSEEWEQWQRKLAKFGVYCDKAAAIPPPQQLITTRRADASPALPSTPVSLQASPPTLPHPFPTSATSPYASGPAWFPGMVVAAAATAADQNSRPTRKRSHPHDADEPPSKRPTRSMGADPAAMSAASRPPTVRRDGPRLPVPNLTISTSQAPSHGMMVGNGFPQQLPVLPPLTGRAMSTVYPTTPTHAQSFPVLTPTGMSMQQHHAPRSAGPRSTHGTPSRRQSPGSLQELLAFGSSPMSSAFPMHGAGGTGSAHVSSPSYFLQQRSSPYRPVRHVNTLLYPPPSASLHDYQAANLQMHYQPLGRRDVRTGILPQYTPNAYTQWPVLPQPQYNPR